jgi:cell division protein FtsL
VGFRGIAVVSIKMSVMGYDTLSIDTEVSELNSHIKKGEIL